MNEHELHNLTSQSGHWPHSKWPMNRMSKYLFIKCKMLVMKQHWLALKQCQYVHLSLTFNYMDKSLLYNKGQLKVVFVVFND